MTRRVLVTGGAGFIGSHIVQAHLDAGDEVSVLDDLSSGQRSFVPSCVPLVTLDITTPAAQEFVATGRFDVLNHQAAQVDVRVSVSDPGFDARVNVLGWLNLLEGVRRGGVRRVVFASSGGTVYGDAVSPPLPESAPKLPRSPYGTAKLAGEYYLAALGGLHGFETVALRYANVYGPRQNPEGEAGVVAIFGRRLLAGETLTVFGDGRQTRDFVFVEDVAAANLAAATVPLPPVTDIDTRAYNIGTGRETDVLRLVKVLADITGREPRLVHAPERAGELRRNALAVDKAAQVLGWRAQTELGAGLTTTLHWLMEN